LKDEAEHEHKDLSWNDVGKQVLEWICIDIKRVNWFSTYRVHHRVADCFARGRAFLLGDAAHIHSPVGGQGMNTGIGDAVNLAWKLAAVVHGRADTSLLDSYAPERIAFARRLVATTDKAFTVVTSSGAIARLLRLRIVPLLMPLFFRFRSVRRYMFRTVSQTTVNYRGSSLSEGRAGSVHGGDRLPWIPASSDGVVKDNFAPLTSLDWQAHVYGDATTETEAMCGKRKLSLYVFPWRPEMSRTGLQAMRCISCDPTAMWPWRIPWAGSWLTKFALPRGATLGYRMQSVVGTAQDALVVAESADGHDYVCRLRAAYSGSNRAKSS
jgi:hypothetical protein